MIERFGGLVLQRDEDIQGERQVARLQLTQLGLQQPLVPCVLGGKIVHIYFLDHHVSSATPSCSPLLASASPHNEEWRNPGIEGVGIALDVSQPPYSSLCGHDRNVNGAQSSHLAHKTEVICCSP